jgi:hypothetical protein
VSLDLRTFQTSSLNVATNVGDDDLLEMLACASERYEGGLTAYVPRDFQLRIAVCPARITWRFHSKILSSQKRGRPVR